MEIEGYGPPAAAGAGVGLPPRAGPGPGTTAARHGGFAGLAAGFRGLAGLGRPAPPLVISLILQNKRKINVKIPNFKICTFKPVRSIRDFDPGRLTLKGATGQIFSGSWSNLTANLVLKFLV